MKVVVIALLESVGAIFNVTIVIFFFWYFRVIINQDNVWNFRDFIDRWKDGLLRLAELLRSFRRISIKSIIIYSAWQRVEGGKTKISTLTTF